jgi:ATP-binding protein involved in chromosome partitioning
VSITAEDVQKALSYVIEPDVKKDLISADLVSNIEIAGKTIKFDLQVSNPTFQSKKRIEEACQHQIDQKIGDGYSLDINFSALPKNPERELEQRTVLPGVKHIIAVASGKGGVGKSTITANLAAGLAMKGYKVGLIDADIYGPSQPLMFDVAFEKPQPIDVDGKQLIAPIDSYGVKIMSIGFFAGANDAVVWRGPMASKALEQMVKDVHWGELDYMLLDLPPGTGDIHLTMVQETPLSGAIVVSTPQPIALADARKGINMFRLESVQVPVFGLVENMSYFTPAELPDHKYYIFGMKGAEELAQQMDVDFLGEIPLVQSIRESGDVGRPAVLQGDTTQALAFSRLVDSVVEKLKP